MTNIFSKKNFIFLSYGYLIVLLLFVYAPVFSLVLVSLQSQRIMSFPIDAFTLKWYLDVWNNNLLLDAAINSIFIGTLAGFGSTVFGFLSAHFICRQKLRRKLFYVVFISLPFLTPLLLSGLSLLMFYQSIKINGSHWSIIVAHICYCSPFSLAIIRNSYEKLNIEVEFAAHNLGAKPWVTIFKIVLPQLKLSLMSSFIISFLISWDEFTLAWFLGGFTKTLPVVIYGMLGTSFSPQINAAGSIAMLISVLLLLMFLVLQVKMMRTRTDAE